MKLIKSEIDLMLKYHSPGSRYSYFPSVSYWQNSVSKDGLISHLQKSYDPKQGIDLYIHIPFCESLCTFCGCNIKITKNHKEGISYVDSLEKEWQFFKKNIILCIHITFRKFSIQRIKIIYLFRQIFFFRTI